MGARARAPRRRRRSRDYRPLVFFTVNYFCVQGKERHPVDGVDHGILLDCGTTCVCGGWGWGGVGAEKHPVDGVDHGHQLRVALEAQQRLRHRVQRPHNLPPAAPRRANTQVLLLVSASLPCLVAANEASRPSPALCRGGIPPHGSSPTAIPHQMAAGSAP